MNGKSFDQVEVLSFDDAKYVIGNSLFKAVGKASGNFNNWFKNQAKKHKLVHEKDYVHYGEEILFSCEAAVRIFERGNKPKTEPRSSPRKSRHGYELDEYGLPILPPQERRGALINPYRI